MNSLFKKKIIANRDGDTRTNVVRPIAERVDIVLPGLKAGIVAPAQSALPAFKSTASDQLVPGQTPRLAKMRADFREAFTPSRPIVDPALFAGRRKALSSLIQAIEDHRTHAVIYGERGIGKTSMLQMLAAQAKQANYCVVYASCGADSNFDEVFRSISAEVPLLYHEAFGPTAAESERHATMAHLLSGSRVTVGAAADAFKKVVGTRVLVLLDEFDRVKSAEFRHSIAELLKNLSDRSARVQFVIAGVAANLADLIEYLPSTQRNVFALEIPKLTSEEIEQLALSGAARSGMTVATEAVHMIDAMSNGLPYLASLLCHHAGLIALDSGRDQISYQDVEEGVQRTISELHGHVSRLSLMQIHSKLDEKGRRIFGQMAGLAQSAGGVFTLEGLGRLYGSSYDAEAVTAALEHFASEGILVKSVNVERKKSFGFVEENLPLYLWLVTTYEGLKRERGDKLSNP